VAGGRLGENGEHGCVFIVNQCLLEVEVLEEPKIRYTQDNQTPIAEMAVRLDGLRPEDPAGDLKVVGFGSLAQDLQNRVLVGQRVVVEGRLRMNTVARPDGVKEKRVEFTLSRLHPFAPSQTSSTTTSTPISTTTPTPISTPAKIKTSAGVAPVVPATPVKGEAPSWNTGPLVDLPEDEIPF